MGARTRDCVFDLETELAGVPLLGCPRTGDCRECAIRLGILAPLSLMNRDHCHVL